MFDQTDSSKDQGSNKNDLFRILLWRRFFFRLIKCLPLRFTSHLTILVIFQVPVVTEIHSTYSAAEGLNFQMNSSVVTGACPMSMYPFLLNSLPHSPQLKLFISDE